MDIVNSIKAFKNVLTGKSLASFTTVFYDSRYPPTKFLKPNLPKINIKCIMSGFPRTGTHWIRNVIEKSTGQKTGDLYEDKPSPSDKNVILVKIHARNKFVARVKALWLLPPHNFGGKYIYTYRDPRDAIISLYEMYKKVKGFDELSPKQYLESQDLVRQYRWEINSWVKTKYDNLLLVKFENLKESPNQEFQKIFKHLDLDCSVKEEYIGEMVYTVDSQKRPRGVAYGWKNAPSEYQVLIEMITTQLENEIKYLGYDPK